MGPCGGTNDAPTTVGILAKDNTVHNFEIAFDLPDGVAYKAGSATITFQQGSGDYILSEMDISDLNAPVFSVERPGDANWQVADLVRFRFGKTASCDAVMFSYGGGLFKDAHTATYNDSNGTQTASDNDPTINSYNFFSAYLAVSNYSSVAANIGDTVTRNLEISNSGNGTITSFTHNVTVGNSLGSYGLSFNGSSLAPASISGDTYTYQIDLALPPFVNNIGDGDVELENETMLFEETFTVDGCEQTQISHQPTWGCSSSQICQALEPISASILLNPELPEIKVSKINPPANTDLCLATTHTINISNDSQNGPAYNVEINTGFGPRSGIRTTRTANALWGNDHPTDNGSISNFRFGSNPSFTLPQRPTTEYSNVGAGSYFISDTHFTSDPDGPGGLEDLDGDGFFDDMAPGESTNFLFDLNLHPDNTIACGEDNKDLIRYRDFFCQAYASNQCREYPATSSVLFSEGGLFRRAFSSRTPTDLHDGVGFKVGVQGVMYSWGSNRPHCNGTQMFSTDPNSSWTVTLNVPTGVTLDGSPPGFTQVDPNTIVYTTTDIAETYTFQENVDFPLVFDLSLYTGPDDTSFSYTARYECSCYAQDIACGSISGIRIHRNISCDGPNIRSFDSQRVTAGWTDDTMTTLVTLDPNVHKVDTYMAKDEMVLRTSAVMNNVNPNNLYFDLDYGTGSVHQGGPDIIQFLDGTITINDLSSGTYTVPITVAPVLTTNGTTTHKLTFDLSSYTSAVGPTYTYGEPLLPLGTPQADEVDLELHFIFKEDFTKRASLTLTDFSGSFYDGVNTACHTIGDSVYYFKNYLVHYATLSTGLNGKGCDPTYIEVVFKMESVAGNQFPGEYRPPSIWQSTEFEIPDGLEFTGLAKTYSFPGTGASSTNGGLLIDQTGNLLTVSPGPTAKEFNVKLASYPRIHVHFQGSNALAPDTSVNWTSKYKEFAYSSAPVDKIQTGSYPFHFTPPDFTLSSPTPVVSGSQASATFEVDLCMSDSSDVDFNWLQIQNGTSFSVINAVEVVGSVENPLNFSENGGNTWIELGQYLAGTNICKKIRFEVDFTECTNFDFVVENTWGCNGYPTDFSTANYMNPLTLRLEPNEAAVQIAILNEPTSSVDICSNFNIDLELRNAGNGDLIDPVVTFDIPGDATSLTLNQINVEYPRNSGNVQPVSYNLSGNTVTLNLSEHTGIATNSGIQGSLNAGNIEEQVVIVQLDLNVQCNFISNTAITYEVHGNNPCGTPATGDGSRLSTNPIKVTGANKTYDAFSNIAVPAGGLFSGCASETITVETTIVGGPTTDLDYGRIILPNGLAFIPGSFVSNNPAYPITYGSISTIGDHEEIIVSLPGNANNGANPSYSFDVMPRNTSGTCSPAAQIEVLNFTVVDALNCGAISCTSTQIAVGSSFENVIISKAELVESSFISNADYTMDESGNYEYHLEFGVENTGTVDIEAGFIYNVFCADSGGNKTGAPIFNGTVAQPIVAGGSITEDILFGTTDFCGDNGNLIIEFVPSSTNCHCDVLSIPLTSEPEIIDLDITSSVAPLNVNVGDTVTFAINVLNNGPFEAENVLIENIVPPGYTVTGINDGGTQAGNTISWPVFDLTNANTVTLGFSATINTPTGTAGEFENVSQVVGVDEHDPDSTPNNYSPNRALEDDEAISSVHILAVDLSISKGLSATSNPNPVIGETVDFEIIVSNNGPDTANNITIEDVVPIGFTVNAVSIGNGGTLNGNTISWNIPTLNNGASMTLTYSASVNAYTRTPGEYTNIAQITAVDEFDPDSQPNNYDPNRALEDDEAVYMTTVQSADLEIINTIAPNSANPGDTVIITVNIVNNGPNDATNVSIENIVPIGFAATNIGNSGGQNGNTITWNGLNIPSGSNLGLTYEATINIPTNGADEYLNTVQVVSVDQYDPDSFPDNDDGDQSEDDEDNAQITLIAADLSLTKGLGPTSNTFPNSGDTITFEITLTNSGPNDATNVTVEDIVPEGYTLGTVNGGATVSGNRVNWAIPTMPVGSQTLSYDVTINPPTGIVNEYLNVAQITTTDQFDLDSSPNNDDGDQSEDDEASYAITPPTVDLEVLKTADKLLSSFEDTVVFTITVHNNSTYDATNIGIEDALPTGFALVSHTTDQGSYDQTISTWEIPVINSGGAATLEMTTTVTDTGDYTNIALLAYLDQIDDNVSNDRSEVSVKVTQEECLTVFNEFSPNHDGANEVFFIECIEQYPNNMLQVFNRWGTKVFEMESYDNSWDGTSMARATINASEKLPVGTYYYVLDPRDGKTPVKSGWLYIAR